MEGREVLRDTILAQQPLRHTVVQYLRVLYKIGIVLAVAIYIHAEHFLYTLAMFVESAKGQWTIRHGIRLPHHADIFKGEWIAGEQQIQQPYIAIIRFPFHFSAHAIDDLYLKTTLKLV